MFVHEYCTAREFYVIVRTLGSIGNKAGPKSRIKVKLSGRLWAKNSKDAVAEMAVYRAGINKMPFDWALDEWLVVSVRTRDRAKHTVGFEKFMHNRVTVPIKFSSLRSNQKRSLRI